MRISQNEIYRMGQRALEGAGAPYGLDREGARATAWLEARGLPGLAILAASLPAMGGAFAPLPPPRQRGSAGELDLAERPCLAWAGAVLDCFTLLVPDAGADLLVRRARWPLSLLPALVPMARRGRGLRLSWEGQGGGFICSVGPTGACRIAGTRLPGGLRQALLSPDPVDAAIRDARSAVRGPDRDPAARVIDDAALDAALGRSLAEGVEVEDALWNTITTAAARVLVPASEESRARGAGGGDANA